MPLVMHPLSNINNTSELLRYLRDRRADTFGPAMHAYEDAIKAVEVLVAAQEKIQRDENWFTFPPELGGE